MPPKIAPPENAHKDTPIRIARLTLHTEPPAATASLADLRGAIARIAPELDLLHQHTEKGFLYRYPKVQYRRNGGKFGIIGIDEGACILLKLPLAGTSLHLRNRRYRIVRCDISLSESTLRVTSQLRHYRLQTPALLLNKENFIRYGKLVGPERSAFLDRICVSQILRVAKGIGVWLNNEVIAALALQKTLPCTFKKRTFLGFQGELITNVELPPGIGFGKAVAFGYGVLASVGATARPANLHES